MEVIFTKIREIQRTLPSFTNRENLFLQDRASVVCVILREAPLKF